MTRRWEVLDFHRCTGKFDLVGRYFTAAGAQLAYRWVAPFLRYRGGEFALVLRDRKTGRLYRIEGQR